MLSLTFLYLLCGELLAHQIRQNSDTEGIDVFGLLTKCMQFADDTGLFLKFKVETLNAVIDTLGFIEANT